MEKGTIKLVNGDNSGNVGFRMTNLEDGTPALILIANVSHGKSVFIDRIMSSLAKIRLLALPAGKADAKEICKRYTDDLVDCITIPLALGGADVLCLEKTCHDCLKRCKCK